MARKIFQGTTDIHTGGVGLISPHHENEIAQSEAAYGGRFARHWVHKEHLLADGAKMSKSKDNFHTLRDISGKGYSTRSIRNLLLSAHYKKQLNFTFDGLKQADNALRSINNFLLRLNDVKYDDKNNPNMEDLLSEFILKFTETVDDDLNMSGGMGVFFDFVHAINSLVDNQSLSMGAKWAQRGRS